MIRATSRLLSGWAVVGSFGGGDCGPATIAGMQGTVATYDAETLAGTILLDDGVRVEFDADAFRASGLRLLRFGQRVRLETDPADPSGRIIRIAIPTMP
jgi:cold shock CspA family protein